MRSNKVLIIVVAVAAAGAVWVAVRSFTRDPAATRTNISPRPVAAASDPPGSLVGPSGDSWGVPTGYGPTKPGARAAAVGWVSALGPLMGMGPVAADETLRSLLTSAAAEATISSFRDERTRFAKQFGADPINALWADTPLSVTVSEFDSERAVVKVWSELVMGVATGSVTVLWRTQTITLLWERGDWRIDMVSRVEGPSPDPDPTQLPSTGAELAAVIGWTPAVLAGSSIDGGG